jgi:hypothetical protein
MPSFKIFGAWKETAEDVEIVVNATDFREAQQKANKMGIYVSKVEPATEPGSISEIVNTPPNLDATTLRDELRKTVHSGCHACGGDKLINQKIYRLSGPAVVIGYILLIPSFIGILLNTLFLIIISAGASSSANSSSAIQQSMMQNDPTIDPQIAESAADAFAGAACCFGGLLGIGPLLGMILCFVGGLLGWLLIMKKKVKVCCNCKTIVSNIV